MAHEVCRRIISGLVISSLLVVSACSKQAWYEGLKSSERQRCQQYQSPEVDGCISYSEMDYGDYQTEREGAVQAE